MDGIKEYIQQLTEEDLKQPEVLRHLCVWLWEDIKKYDHHQKYDSKIYQLINQRLEVDLNIEFLAGCPMCMLYLPDCIDCPLCEGGRCRIFYNFVNTHYTNVRYRCAKEIISRVYASMEFDWETTKSWGSNLPTEGSVIIVKDSYWEAMNGVCRVIATPSDQGNVHLNVLENGLFMYFPTECNLMVDGKEILPQFRYITKA